MSQETYKIDFAVIEDLNDVVNLVNSAYRGESGKQGWTTESDIIGGQRTEKACLLEDINRENSDIIIVRNACNEIVGCCHVEKSENNSCYLGMLSVKPTLQKSGIGKLLICESARYAKSMKCEVIEITVITIRHDLIAWYEKQGFIRTGIIKPFPYGDERFGIPFFDDLKFEVLTKKIN